MAKTVGCTDFEQNCDFRITAGDTETELIEATASAHALKYHPEFADNDADMRAIIRTHIKSLLSQSHTEFEPEVVIVKV
ncbi:DUF1059 domain-containing protein [Candidatus Saccharibacteria bacterium]|nr:DUF1059 domain-containing protein [Candidatus Saccharibacteria bacterium]